MNFDKDAIRKRALVHHALDGRVMQALEEVFATIYPVGTWLVMKFIEKMIGLKYGAINMCMDTEVDCAELPRIAYNIWYGIDIGSFSDAQYLSKLGTTVTTNFADVYTLPSGTLLFYKTSNAKKTGHVSILHDPARILHSGAEENNAKVNYSAIDWNKSRFVCARQFLSPGQIAQYTVGGSEAIIAPTEATYWRLLKFGGVPYTNGADVRRVQTKLKELGFFKASLGGNYGPITEAAVMAFQQHNGLKVDGVVGPITWAVLFDGTAKEKPNVDVKYERLLKNEGKPYMSGDDVMAVQEALTEAGFDPGEIDGDYGPLTEEAVRAFQRDRGLKVDGVVGPITWAALFGA